MKKLTKKIALKMISNIKDHEGDSEAVNHYTDELKTMFIECVSNGLYDKQESVEISSIILNRNIS